jgi:hypothetical protein
MRPALEVADIFRRHGPAYRHAHADHLGRTERRVMAAIEACRTPVLGGHVEHCTDCGLVRCAYNSCRDRHCPKCQALARAGWLDARQAELLPVPYFHVVFTLPAPVAEIAFHNKAVVYAILFRAAAEALRRVAADPRHLGAEIGAVAVLHTWGQALHHHPHLHCIVPGGGIAPDQTRWIACKPGFFLPVRVLSRCLRDLFLDQLRAAFANGELRCSGTDAAPRHAAALPAAPPADVVRQLMTQPRSPFVHPILQGGADHGDSDLVPRTAFFAVAKFADFENSLTHPIDQAPASGHYPSPPDPAPARARLTSSQRLRSEGCAIQSP